MGLKDKLSNIQQELKAPKGQYNSFGGYNYRSCEDILEAIKPLLKANKCTLRLYDTIEQIGDRYYIKAYAALADNESDEIILNTAYAREEESKKGQDGSQITGTASSYARKYALNGLFLIDDTKDADTNESKKEADARAAKADAKTSDNATPRQLDTIRDLAEKQGKEIDEEKLSKMTKEKASALISQLKGGK